MTSREAFEAWIATRKVCTKYGAKLHRSSCGTRYKDLRIDSHWITWQKALSMAGSIEKEHALIECP